MLRTQRRGARAPPEREGEEDGASGPHDRPLIHDRSPLWSPMTETYGVGVAREVRSVSQYPPSNDVVSLRFPRPNSTSTRPRP
jgi:hypothetical protein